jgi:hypothetical protein
VDSQVDKALTPTLSRFEARERELTAPFALCRASKREREGTHGEAVGRVRGGKEALWDKMIDDDSR